MQINGWLYIGLYRDRPCGKILKATAATPILGRLDKMLIDCPLDSK